MFLLKEPSADQVRRFLASQHDLPFSYPEVGASQHQSPSGYNIDHNRIRLGEGEETFSRAMQAIQRWKMFDVGWIRLLWPDAPMKIGAMVAVLVRHYGFWSLNACRIVYLIDEDGPARWYGFAYGTLPDHGERGEERFSVEWHHGDDSVWYDLFAFSRPAHLLSRVGYPLTRALQKRFARDSKQAMHNAVNGQSKS
ncbi:MAG TPA: DUF1990 domain-containing protein [Blastocatellia bacterium]|nr:DUF1990 domain-containing protein [Blastocatellia bacterium]